MLQTLPPPSKWYTDGLGLVAISVGPVQWDSMLSVSVLVAYTHSSSIHSCFEHQVPTNVNGNPERRRFCRSVKEVVLTTSAGVHSYQE